jgi:hypothetical protein
MHRVLISLIFSPHLNLAFHRGFDMRQQAVELALKVDPSLARELAQDSVELEERRRLWLMIAKNAASEGFSGGDVDVVSKVVSVLKDCGPDVLSIEDVSFKQRVDSCWFFTFVFIFTHIQRVHACLLIQIFRFF